MSISTPSWYRASLHDLARLADRASFLYLDYTRVHRDQNSIIAEDSHGVRHVPSTSLTTLMLGPGTSITHQAINLLAESGVTVMWVGEEGTRFYASGRSLATSSKLLYLQAYHVSDKHRRLAVCRRMFEMRFPGEDASELTTRQLLGREGAHMKALYRREAARCEVPWNGRRYDRGNFKGSDTVNQLISTGGAVLYGIAHAAVIATGCAPGLGFVHANNERSFVLDIADLYKGALMVPVAFEQASLGGTPTDMRRAMRDVIREARLLERVVSDIVNLLRATEPTDTADESGIWSDGGSLLEDSRNSAGFEL